MSKSLVERDGNVIWHPYTQMKLAPAPLPIVEGEGAYLIEENGRRYLDAISNWWVTLHGHAHPYLAEKIYEQAKTLEQVIFAGFTHEPAVRLAERLLQVLPAGFSKVFYSDNGSTAVEVALKMAIQYWNNSGGLPRKKVLALTNSYHGDTFGAMSISERGPFTLAFQDYLFEVIFIDPTSTLQPSNLQLTINPEEIACFIYEPLVQGAGGMKMYDAAALDGLLKYCRQHGIICIADEVMTGFGRTGKLFASEYMQETPDIMCLSKGLTGGMMALGATVCTKRIYDAFLSDDRAKTFFHGHSYTANPIACAAGNASLDLLLNPECIGNILRITRQHRDFAAQLKTIKSPVDGALLPVKSVRHLGTILAFEVETEGKDGYLNNIGAALQKHALDKGVLLRPLGNTVYVMPPYCISAEELEMVYGVF